MLISFDENVLSYSNDQCTEFIWCMVGPFEKDNSLDYQGLHTVYKHPWIGGLLTGKRNIQSNI